MIYNDSDSFLPRLPDNLWHYACHSLLYLSPALLKPHLSCHNKLSCSGNFLQPHPLISATASICYHHQLSQYIHSFTLLTLCQIVLAFIFTLQHLFMDYLPGLWPLRCLCHGKNTSCLSLNMRIVLLFPDSYGSVALCLSCSDLALFYGLDYHPALTRTSCEFALFMWTALVEPVELLDSYLLMSLAQ